MIGPLESARRGSHPVPPEYPQTPVKKPAAAPTPTPETPPQTPAKRPPAALSTIPRPRGCVRGARPAYTHNYPNYVCTWGAPGLHTQLPKLCMYVGRARPTHTITPIIYVRGPHPRPAGVPQTPPAGSPAKPAAVPSGPARKNFCKNGIPRKPRARPRGAAHPLAAPGLASHPHESD